MELTERLPLKPIQWLSHMSYSEFVDKCLNKDKKYTTKECKTKYSILQQFCQTNLKTDGITKRIYSYSTGTSGRLFSGGSLQGLPSTIRGLFMGDGVGTDIDMCNAHPIILRYICKLHNIQCPQLEYYNTHREECLAKFETREIGKLSYLSALNKDTMNRTKGLSSEFKKYDAEIKQIQNKLIRIKDYAELVGSVPENKPYNKLGSALNRIMCYYENMILQHAIHVVNKRGIEIAILMFDGLMIYGDYYKNNELLEDISHYIEKQLPDLNMKWTYKEHNAELKVPKDFLFVESDHKVSRNENKEQTFEYIAHEFEKTHLKIINKSLYVKHANNNIIFLTQAQLKMSYSHLSYDVPVYNEKGMFTGINALPFINKWTGFTHNIRRKDDVDIYPNVKDCPEDIFNLWRPFAMEILTESYVYKQPELDFILHHIKILCNHDELVYDYFIKWIAQMIQYPHIKTIMPTFISGEGAGKGTLFKLFEKMLGNEKIFETTNPSRDVWGDFNGMMCNCFLVNLNELSKKDTMESEGKIKGLITDNTLAINQKGLPQYKIKSYHRFITTTNKEEPINSSNGDRRNLIIRSSDEKKGDYHYFETIHNYLENIDVIRTCYDYFKSIEGMDKFKDIPMPQTEYQTNLKELSKSPIELWLESFTREHSSENNTTIELLGNDIYELFKLWCNSNGIKYDINAVKLGVRLTNMNIRGISKGKHTKYGDSKLFDISELRKTFKIGCLIAL